jgi:hypothetical protein
MFIEYIKFAVENLPTKKPIGPGDFPGALYQIFKEEVVPMSDSFLQKTKKDGHLPL